MTHSEKVAAMQRHLVPQGLSPYTLAPPAWRALWALGLQVPPPLFLGFVPLALGAGAVFAVGWGLLMWLMAWWREGLGPLGALVAALVAGALFGLFMAAYYRHQARRFALPAWHDYTGA
jgi:asparagine N-glycosylation enzyme membrane subunit Stt3